MAATALPPGSARLGSGASCPLRARQHHADGKPACSASTPTLRAHHLRPFRSRVGRNLTPQSGDPFARTRRVAPPNASHTTRTRTPPPATATHTVIPAEVALGVISLHKAGIHSPGLGASPRLTRSDALVENCLRHLHRWILGSSPRMTKSPGPTGDTGPRASGECHPCGAPRSWSPQKSRWADTHSTKRGSIHPDLARRPNWLARTRLSRTACGIYTAGSSGQAQG